VAEAGRVGAATAGADAGGAVARPFPVFPKDGGFRRHRGCGRGEAGGSGGDDGSLPLLPHGQWILRRTQARRARGWADRRFFFIFYLINRGGQQTASENSYCSSD